MGGENFAFESFINFVNFLKQLRSHFWNFLWNFVFFLNFNLAVTWENLSQVQQLEAESAMTAA